MLTNRTYCAFAVATAIWLLGVMPPLWSREGGQRPFTVKDTVEFSHIVDFRISEESSRVPGPVVSPDGKHFLLVTTRGILSSNKTESTIWLFDRDAVARFVSKSTAAKPIPKSIASVAATSNMPVLSGVRWLEDSKRIAFLGMNDSPYQRLFIADTGSGIVQPVTDDHMYVSSYDISGDTIAYTVVNTERPGPELDQPFISARGKGIWSLLYPEPPKLEDVERGDLNYTTALHIIRKGQETTSFSLRGNPLTIYPPAWSLAPPLSLSPDGKFLITVAPADHIPSSWGEYEPWDRAFMDRLKPGDQRLLAADNPYKPLQFVVIDVQAGQAWPLVDAPIGRNLGHIVPVKAFWLGDSRRAVLTNTFIPENVASGQSGDIQRRTNPGVILVEVADRKLQLVTYFHASPQGAAEHDSVEDISWDPRSDALTIRYSKDAHGRLLPPETHLLQGGRWVKDKSPAGAVENRSYGGMELSVDESFDQRPTLVGRLPGESTFSTIWDPNPQLADIALGKVSLYRWKDDEGTSWAGLLALPPNYDKSRLYPLVIQTHGYDLNSFFLDGIFATGNPGRALAAKGIVVLQMQDPDTKDRFTPRDGPSAIRGFESAIEQLSRDQLIDPHRVGVIGFSYTCFHTLYTATHRPRLFMAAAINDGNNWSYSQYILRTPDDPDKGMWQRVSEKMNGGVPWGNGGLSSWAERSPDFNLDKVETPLLIAAHERGELLAQWEPYAGLRRLGKPVDMLWLKHEDANHILKKPLHKYVSQQSTADWFEFWLTGEERTESNGELGETKQSLAGQYERWRELRKMREENEKKAAEAKRN
ncbi:MAG TPA: prolyl oligopeptidase family serine peptidase [Candidatus Acidoferrum sp.]|nr:prolyl oligopeptidase family serine peptidase [Candidatus Acidoferrum sp.]